MTCKICDLPTELLKQIVFHLGNAQEVLNLSLTCKKLHDYVLEDGFRTFVRSQYPCFSISQNSSEPTGANSPEFWRDVSHGLTTLSRNWKRRALLAREVRHPEWRDGVRGQRRPGRQSMGYVPVIDSYQIWTGGDWSSRKDVLAWGAGAKFIMRTYKAGGDTSVGSEDCALEWQVCAFEGLRDGRDDITAVHLLPQPTDAHEQCIIGRASGLLQRIRVNQAGQVSEVTHLDTTKRPVRASTIVESGDLLATCLSDTNVVIYDLMDSRRETQPILEQKIQTMKEGVRTWCCHFLNKTKLAVGFGLYDKPIRIFDLQRGGTEATSRNITVQKSAQVEPHRNGTSVYSIVPLPSSSQSSDSPGDLFLSGSFDGVARYASCFRSCVLVFVCLTESSRLHDLRCEETVVTEFDAAASPIYSLLPIGRERFIAGEAMHSHIKIFELRMPRRSQYRALKTAYAVTTAESFDQSHSYTSDYDIFINSAPSSHSLSLSPPDSAVYSLSRPSSFSTQFYAGVLNRVCQVDLLSIYDNNPDPMHASNGLLPTSTDEPDLSGKKAKSKGSFANSKALRSRPRYSKENPLPRNSSYQDTKPSPSSSLQQQDQQPSGRKTKVKGRAWDPQSTAICLTMHNRVPFNTDPNSPVQELKLRRQYVMDAMGDDYEPPPPPQGLSSVSGPASQSLSRPNVSTQDAEAQYHDERWEWEGDVRLDERWYRS